MKDLSWIRDGYFAHRGLHNKEIPENTMTAFSNAVSHGFDIELDIRMTKDKEIIVFHDSSLARLCGEEVKVDESNYSDIENIRVLNSDETIPLLKNVLTLLPNKTEYLIELKPSIHYKEFVKLFIELMSNYQIKYAIHSFDPRIVNEFRKQSPNIIRGQIASTFPNRKGLMRKAIKHLLTNIYTKPDFTNYNFKDLPRKKLDKLYKKGHMVISYVVRSKEDLAFVRKHYDNAVFENFIPEIKKEM
ncbi:cytoplasmic glycerophosphodiester phosphodiesterase [Candidatus Izimaplasma bacterium HR1]|jgi:glycerophosphoryl diester phosphodiesterase|uniref:glycerophosphodiester phosphodiesterase family protein n=1 Tax=Candidatus Izimoplasma sp. HR1 TaxID=1541959 RepID=UPI0004F65CFC|nr:cytoplasmic glycerophosphodiester phosphodiesterase [Candidatus Izimaplasma bacterium HR1]